MMMSLATVRKVTKEKLFHSKSMVVFSSAAHNITFPCIDTFKIGAKANMHTISLLETLATTVLLLLVVSAVGFSESVDDDQLQQLADYDSTLSDTMPPTLPTISVTLPAGVTAHDADIADVIDSLIRGEPFSATNDDEKLTTSKLPNPSRTETRFRQDIKISNPRELTREEIELFEDLLRHYTVYFSPLSIDEVESRISSKCTVYRQVLRMEEVHLQHWVINTVQLDFILTYESLYYDVADYPKLFQDWTSNNLDVLLDQLQFLNLDITSVDSPRSILPSSIPTLPPTSQHGLVAILPELENNDLLSIVPKESRWSVTAIVVFSISLLVAVGILTVAISISLGNRREHGSARVEEQKQDVEEDSCQSSTVMGVSPRYEDTLPSLNI